MPTPHKPHPILIIAINGPIGGGKSTLLRGMGRILSDRGVPYHFSSFVDAAKEQINKLRISQPITAHTGNKMFREFLCNYCLVIHKYRPYYWDNLWLGRQISIIKDKLFDPMGNYIAGIDPLLPYVILVDSLRLPETVKFLEDLSRKPIQGLKPHYLLLSPFSALTPNMPYLGHVDGEFTREFERLSEIAGRGIASAEHLQRHKTEADRAKNTIQYATYTLPILGRIKQRQFTTLDITVKLTQAIKNRNEQKSLSKAQTKHNYNMALNVLNYAYTTLNLPGEPNANPIPTPKDTNPTPNG